MIKPFGDTSKLDTYIAQARRIRNAANEVEAGAALFSIIQDYIDTDAQVRRTRDEIDTFAR